MSFDLNILYVNQKRKKVPKDRRIYVKARNKNKDVFPKYYDDTSI
ncbi:hypothetical protein [Candidatus Enterococcus moelleringii]|nr:hypothetical protein [Enterococcus sp. 669A]